MAVVVFGFHYTVKKYFSLHLKGYMIFYGLSRRTLEVSVIPVVNCLITVFVSEILKYKALAIRHLGCSKNARRRKEEKCTFFKEQLTNMFNVKIHVDLYLCTF